MVYIYTNKVVIILNYTTIYHILEPNRMSSMII